MRPASFTRSRTLYALLVLGLAALALRPSALVEDVLDVAFLPTRALAELAAPIEWLSAGEVRAAEQSLAHEAGVARARAEALFVDEQNAALPERAELALGRRFVHGEVVRRGAGDLDSVVVRLASVDGVVPGLPVVAGDHYVGRVIRTLSGSEASVALVTGKAFFVGAEVLPPGDTVTSSAVVLLTAGGLAPRVEDEVSAELAVHNPSRKPPAGGEVVVREVQQDEPRDESPIWNADRWAELANGFRLGELEQVELESGASLSRIRPGLDYQSGLFQVLAVAAAESGTPAELRLALDTFEPDAWIALSALPGGEIDPARHGRRFALPFGHGLGAGDALAWAGHFLGRIERVSGWSADARLLGDPGLVLAALARVEGVERPFALGELVSLGRRRADGAIRLRWNARVALGGDGPPAGAELFTGSGVEGVPRGLYLGTAELPRTSGSHVVALHPAPEARSVRQCVAWRGLAEEHDAAEGAH